jgi:hypothetical protein
VICASQVAWQISRQISRRFPKKFLDLLNYLCRSVFLISRSGKQRESYGKSGVELPIRAISWSMTSASIRVDNLVADLLVQIAELRGRVHELEARDGADYTIPEWCRKRRMSKAAYFENRKRGLTPRERRHGTAVRISREADRDWAREREAVGGGTNM